jgi:hypothetical protein
MVGVFVTLLGANIGGIYLLQYLSSISFNVEEAVKDVRVGVALFMVVIICAFGFEGISHGIALIPGAKPTEADFYISYWKHIPQVLWPLGWVAFSAFILFRRDIREAVA